MAQNLKARTAAVIVVMVVFLFGIFGIPTGGLKAAIQRQIHLGLDLKGGAHLVLRVNVVEAVSAATDSDVARLQSDLQKEGISGVTVIKQEPLAHPDVIMLSNVPINSVGKVREVLDGPSYSNLYEVSSDTNGFHLTMKQQERKALEKRTVDTSIETINQRINSLGVSEARVEPFGLGEDEILVELPGVSNADEIHAAINNTARLEIHEVIGDGTAYPNEQAAVQAQGGTLPPDEMVVKGASSVTSNAGDDQYYVVRRASIVSGSDFRDAQPQRNPNTGGSETNFNLTTGAGEHFYEYTSNNIGKYMAVVLENRVRSVAVIRGAIRDNGVIEGLGEQEAKSLSQLLRSGSLPASITYLETRTVGASLGASSIRQGIVASVAGMAAVMIFMLIYYKGAGINADLALILNLVILLGFMGFFHGVLTLPGIAGVILTIGMGVDSNVLIFERIREELRAGKTAAAAVQQGFAHAWITIVDTHVTTIVSAGILYIFGSGPVRGFALTLTFGLLANLFTAVFVSRLIFDALLSRKDRNATLSI